MKPLERCRGLYVLLLLKVKNLEVPIRQKRVCGEGLQVIWGYCTEARGAQERL